MRKITNFIIKARNIIIVLFIFLSIISVILSQKVNINHDMTKYLPKDSETKIGLEIMDKEFEEEKESFLNVMFKNLNEEEKDEVHKKLLEIEGISKIDYDKGSEEYNKDNNTLYKIKVDDTDDSEIAKQVYNNVTKEFEEYDFYTSGNIKDRNMVILPTWIIVVAVSIVAIILVIMCESYIEPVIFLICIGIAILINNGTNIIFGTVSNITNSITAILQLALSMDYSIMLINRYRQEKENNDDKVEAMKEALYKSFSSICSSSLTTIVGLLTLVFMSFTIGRDLGLVLAKGVLLSLLVIFTCLPALILMFDKLILKTKKKTPNIKLNKLGNIIYKFRIIGFALIIVLFVGSYISKGNLKILYTPSDENKIAEVFKENNQLGIIYNNKDEEKVANYINNIESDENVNEVLAYGNTIGEKLKYNEFNGKLEELETNTQIDEYLLKILYYNYFNENQINKMTFNEFVDFIENNVLNNNYLSSKLDNNVKNEIKRLKKFTSNQEMNKKRSYKEIAEILDISERDSYNLFVYYYADKVNVTITIKDFIDFINRDVLTDSEYSNNIPVSARNSLKTINKFIDKNQINRSMSSMEMANLFELDKEIVDQLYLYYYSINDINNSKISINEFTNFIIDNVLVNEQYSSGFDKKDIENLKMIKIISDKNIIDKEMSASELSKIFGLNENLINQLLILQQITTGKQTPYQFVEFILNNIENPLLLSNISEENIYKIKMIYNIMNSSKNNEKFAYNEISEILNIDSNMIKSLYILYATKNTEIKLTPLNFVEFILQHKDDEILKGNLNQNTLESLRLAQTIMVSTINNKKYNANEISNLLGLNKEDCKLLYSLYSAKNVNSNINISLKEFVAFILKDVVTNEKYSAKFDNSKILKLNTINGIMKAVINNIEYNPGEIYAIISNLTNAVDEDMVEVLYIYYGSEKYYQENWEITIEELINYINDKILIDTRFDDFIEENVRKDVVEATNTIQENKNKLVGENYSRIIINSKYDLETDEVYEFIQKIYDNLEETESYIIGDSPMSYEISKTFRKEFDYISILTMIAIYVVVALTFKSFIIPIILVLLIQCAVYMTMGIIGITSGHVYFIALLVVQSILMGATIDYAIVYTSYYIESRETMNIKESIKNAYNKSIHTILTSSSILIIATFLVGKFASGIVSMLCKTLAQGVLCSTILILIILPAVLTVVDKFVVKKNKEH